jgi:hypothetical protein
VYGIDGHHQFFSPVERKELTFSHDNDATMTSIGASTTHTVKVKKPTRSPACSPIRSGARTVPTKTTGAKKTSVGHRGTVAPLKPATLTRPEAVEALLALDEQGRHDRVVELFRQTLGEQSLVNRSKPHAASTTQDRAGAAADLAIAVKNFGIPFCLKKCRIMDEMQLTLFPHGLDMLFHTKDDDSSTFGLRPNLSSLSLVSMDDTTMSIVTGNSGGTDSKRGKTSPPNAREGCLLLIRAMCERLGKAVEPYFVGGFLAAALDECGSSSSAVRQAAEDSAVALVKLAHPWAFPRLICPLLVKALESTEWRVKFNALERLVQCATTAPIQVCQLLPQLIPVVTNQVWDTKAQVTRAAGSALLAMCETNQNPDVAPAIPFVVSAICKPSETNRAVQELMGTTFVASVDASTLSILCPVLARALKEKLAINKRAACIVISNMSRLVDSPSAVAPFGPLLVPELQKVASNVQFEEIRDAALAALGNLTKALGDSYIAASEENSAEKQKADEMAKESARIEAEKKRIEDERLADKAREEEIRKREEEERRKFKEAMDAQRALDKLAEKEALQNKADEAKKREAERLSTKTGGGKCQGCGLKKCKKSCVFFSA